MFMKKTVIKGIIALSVLTSAVVLSACTSSIATETVKISDGESLEIITADVTDKASFYPVDIDGTEMEIIAVKDSSGNIRTAFNTCQVCYASGNGYYKQEGNNLVCQNCKNEFTADDVGIQAGGCNPVPITDENKTVTDETIEISYDFLKQAEQIFANWKTQY